MSKVTKIRQAQLAAKAKAGKLFDKSSASIDLVGLTRIQEKKLRYLIEKGGNHSAVTVHIGMPDGSLADVDPFGRVTWRGR